MEAHGKSTEASLLQPREGAGKYWWETFVRTHISDINRRFNQAKALYIPNLESSLAPVDLFSYVREAALCFEIGRYLPAIFLASKSVELIMARDTRMRAHPELLRAADNTITLCSSNLVIARKLGLPVDRLLSPEGESGSTYPVCRSGRKGECWERDGLVQRDLRVRSTG